MTEESLFAAALEKPAGPERQAYLDEACGGDAAKRERIDRLLAADEQSRGILEPGPDVAADAPPPQPALAAGRILAGRFKLRQKLDSGGMGEVWVADQFEPVQRRVAIKVERPGFDSEPMLARFEHERQALALMDHPNIAKVLDAGAADGRPYFVMELIKGVPVTRYCDDAKLTPRERLELFIPVCHAVQHAHQKGIIHRDLKPSNIVVGMYDGKPVPKVIDFGVAKAIGPRLTEKTVYTEVGTLIGTLEYMSPEQAELNNLDIDTRSDIYTLGAILYELLTGGVPFSRKEFQAGAFAEMLRMIREVDPPKPSTKLSGSGTLPSVAAVRHTEPKKLVALIRGELDWIVLKCLEKDRSRRYETANGLAQDLQRYLADEPVEASPPSAGYRVRKFVRRNSGTVLAASVIVLLLAVGIFGTTIGLIRAEKLRVNALAAAEAQRLATLDAEKAAAAERVAKESAQHRLTQIENSNEILGSIFHDIDPRNEQAEGRPLRALLGDRLREAAVKLDGEAVGDPLTVARLQRLLGDALYGLGDAEKAIPLFVKARATFTERRGADHLDTIQTMDHLALAYTALGRSKEALALHLEATGLAKAKYPDSQATLSVMHNLAWDYYSAGKSELAIPLLEETLKRRQVTLGPDDVRTLETMNALGLLYVESRKLDVALPLLDETVRLRKARLGPEHTDYLASLNNLAMAYNAAGKLDLALPRYEEVVRLITAKLGPDHPHTLTSMNNLAFTYRTAGKLDLALPLAERAAAGVEKRKYETENARKILFTLMDIYERLDRLDQADAWRRKWLAAVREKSGAESPPMPLNYPCSDSTSCSGRSGATPRR
ncbi:MAG TPA: serine/threonine-protein kinase [Gemmataceae bacterium]|nr:serine/threonine-protein kinase [Gemmataceae bacterium]